MNEAIYFILGIGLGLSISLYLYANRKEKVEKTIIINQKVFSTEKLDKTMETYVKRIQNRMIETKKELTEEEKNEIIEQCYKEKFNIKAE